MATMDVARGILKSLQSPNDVWMDYLVVFMGPSGSGKATVMGNLVKLALTYLRLKEVKEILRTSTTNHCSAASSNLKTTIHSFFENRKTAPTALNQSSSRSALAIHITLDSKYNSAIPMDIPRDEDALSRNGNPKEVGFDSSWIARGILELQKALKEYARGGDASGKQSCKIAYYIHRLLWPAGNRDGAGIEQRITIVLFVQPE